MADQGKKLFDYLNSLDGVDAKHIVDLTIKGKPYTAVEYEQAGQTRLYVLGKLPACYRRSAKTMFRINGGDCDWYVACYMQKEPIEPHFAPFHPCGINFMLFAWDHASHKRIDYYEPRTRDRVNILLQEM